MSSPDLPPDPASSRPIPAQLVPEPRPMPRRRSSALRSLLLALLILGLLGSLGLNFVLLAALSFGSMDGESRVQEKYFSHEHRATNKVAILSVEGMILEGEGFFKRQLDRARDDAKQGRLKALVVRIDSPGGTVAGSDYMYHHLRQFREETGTPIVVSMGAIAASGGYYVAMAVGSKPDTIYAEPSSWVGSIGVIIPHYNLTKLADKVGISDDSVVSHPLKDMGSLIRPMTEQEREIFQGLVDISFGQFKDVVKSGRPKFEKDPQALDKLATGQVYAADQARRDGLIDQIGYVEDAVDRAIALTGVSEDDVTVVKYKPELSFTDLLMGSSARSARGLDLAALLDSTVPRPFYLWTSLPPLARSRG